MPVYSSIIHIKAEKQKTTENRFSIQEFFLAFNLLEIDLLIK